MKWLEISLMKLDEGYIRENSENLYWDHLSYNQKLSEELIRDFKDKVDWCCISKHQILSESFIREFKDKVDWVFISKYQNLSEEFIVEFQDKIRLRWLSKNNNNICKYSEKLQRLMLEAIIDLEGILGAVTYYGEFMTPYMRKQIEKLSIFV